ncbi:YesK family protein [Solibacillus sp. FSL W7-1436]|uniref:YesK family protein n=1 Tax=Solibacillus sp. FSL W7-1436 TaxID=2921705 RepID=UPI0030F820CB
MDALMLDGWTPLLLLGILFAFMMFFIGRKVSKNILLLTSAIMSLLCFGLILFSILVVGGWEGMGLGFFAITIFIGVWIGTVFGIIYQNTK